MGEAHLKSFLKIKKNYIIYLVEKKKERIYKLKKKIEESFKNNRSIIKYLIKIPQKKKIDFAIVSTLPNQRYRLTKMLLKTNNVNYLFAIYCIRKAWNVI